jgi:Tannase and feruloyl esterase
MRFTFALFVSAVVALVSSGASAATCSTTSLNVLSLPNTTITLAQSYNAGDTVSGTTKAPAGLCRVAGTVKPGANSNIHFEVWIPTDGSWNGKYQQIGNGGFAGSISLPTIANGVSRGYATAGTDDGTSGPPSGAPAFIGNTDVLFDYGYRAIKVTTDDSKAIIAALMGNAPRLSYFVGCSDGGREALKEAQRYPDDFDGIIVGSPVNDQVGEFGSSYLFDSQVVLNGPQTNGVPDAYIPPSMLPVLSNAALAQCVGKDGGAPTDTFLSDPTQCLFDPGTVQCKRGQDPSTCLSAAQVAAARQIYAGPHDNGHLLFPGYEPGGEAATGDWQSWITGNSPTAHGSQYTLGFGFGCDLMQGVTSCDYLSIDVVQQDRTARKTLQPILSSVDPDLRPFRDHGAKMIQYAGWADTAIAPQNGLNYYRKVLTTVGPKTPDFYRVFMVPGMAHCSGGAGVNAFGNGTTNGPSIDADHDLLKALERWVEQGVAPNRIIATHFVNNAASQGVQFQRPLCPYPQRGEYQGGDPNSAASFACVPHHDSFDPRNVGPQVAYEPQGEQTAANR